METKKELLSEKDFSFITSKYGTFKAKRELIEKLLKERENIIYALAEELYKNEVVDTHMRSLVIGEEKDYASKEDWIDSMLDALRELDEVRK